ncbi:Pre-mRNA-splicing factor cef1, partial [Cryomyces antarcticus]
EEDRVANEIRNARARTETQSALLGGDNAELFEGNSTTGYDGVAPSRQQIATPNPMATPFRQGGANGIGATPMRTPMGPGATPMRTPRDNFRLNQEDGTMQLVGQTPRDVRLHELAMRENLKNKFASLPAPKETEWELELPEEQQEIAPAQLSEEDAAERDRREQAKREAAERVEFERQTQVVQKALPRPS